MKNIKYLIKTFGCQMNARDSEKIDGMLSLMGYDKTYDYKESNIIIFNTCTVRENANEKLYGHLGQLKSLKKEKNLIIGICGCMMQDKKARENVLKHYPFVDLIFGTHNIHKLPDLLDKVIKTNKRVIDVWDKEDGIHEDIPSINQFKYKASVNITYGCNNFCSYCIVPFTRGRLRSRTYDDIINECRNNVDNGVIEIMLLGQNVDSYGKDSNNMYNFAELLDRVSDIDGLKRIRFMTSHPKDMSENALKIIKNKKNICRHFHLPVQSGSNNILKKMNRGYTREQYIELISMIRDYLPDSSITTDIIVGFPTETEKDFNDTIDIIEKVRFNSAFTFIFSPRSMTKAATMEGQIEKNIINNRFNKLLDVVKEVSSREYYKLVGSDAEVLIESTNKKDNTLVTGRTMTNEIVHFKGCKDDIGKIKKVKLKKCEGFYYIGE